MKQSPIIPLIIVGVGAWLCVGCAAQHGTDAPRNEGLEQVGNAGQRVSVRLGDIIDYAKAITGTGNRFYADAIADQATKGKADVKVQGEAVEAAYKGWAAQGAKWKADVAAESKRADKAEKTLLLPEHRVATFFRRVLTFLKFAVPITILGVILTGLVNPFGKWSWLISIGKFFTQNLPFMGPVVAARDRISKDVGTGIPLSGPPKAAVVGMVYDRAVGRFRPTEATQ